MFTYETRPVELGQGVYVHIVLAKTRNNETKPLKQAKQNHQNETSKISK